MNTDIRLSVNFFNHHKTKKLRKRLGVDGILCLLTLWLWVTQNRPDGELENMTEEDIEINADWEGEEGLFCQTLLEYGWLDKTAHGYAVHDWADHNSWQAGAEERSNSSRLGMLIRWNPAVGEVVKRHNVKGITKEEYSLLINASASEAEGYLVNTASEQTPDGKSTNSDTIVDYSDTNSPSPFLTNTSLLKDLNTCSPEGERVKNSEDSKAKKQQRRKALEYTPEFEKFWEAYPRKVEKRKAFKAWEISLRDKSVQATPEKIISAAESYGRECSAECREAKYIKHPATFLGRDAPWEEYAERKITQFGRTLYPVNEKDFFDPKTGRFDAEGFNRAKHGYPSKGETGRS